MYMDELETIKQGLNLLFDLFEQQTEVNTNLINELADVRRRLNDLETPYDPGS